MKYLFQLLFVLVALWGSQAEANVCLDYDSNGNKACRQSYVYDKLTVYFKDAYGVEQKFFAKRILQKSNSALLHVDYDFVVNCITHCSDNTAVMNRYLWDWKNAIGTDSLYTKQSLCNPNNSWCCSEHGCDDALEQQKNTADIAPAVSDPEQAKFDEKLGVEAVADRIILSSVATAGTGSEIAVLLKENETTDTLAAIVREEGNADSLCYLQTQSQCEGLKGLVLSSEDRFEANLSHSLGEQFNHSLQNFIFEQYLSDKAESDTQHMICSKNNCSVEVSANLL